MEWEQGVSLSSLDEHYDVVINSFLVAQRHSAISAYDCTRRRPGCRRRDSWASSPGGSCTSARGGRFLGNSRSERIDEVGEIVNAPAQPFDLVPEFRHLHRP